MGDLKSITGGKREPCLYCGKAPHPSPLACPRIARLEIDPESATITGLMFWEDFFGEEESDPDTAA